MATTPREIPVKNGVWKVLCETREHDTQVLKQPRKLLLDERPIQASGDTESQGPGQEAGKANIPSKTLWGHWGGRHRAKGHRVTQKYKKKGHRGQPMMNESGDSSMMAWVL
jgi:hypothetical protein